MFKPARGRADWEKDGFARSPVTVVSGGGHAEEDLMRLPATRRSGSAARWAAAVLVTSLLGAGLLAAACGGSTATGGSSASASAAPRPSASGSAAAVVTSAPVQHVTVGDLSMGYRVIGPLAASGAGASAAPAALMPLLLIMGSSGTMDLWSPAFVTALAEDRQVIVFDNRGMGETDDPSAAYPFSQLADDTAGLIKALGYSSVDVLGWSMGGDVAVDLAVRHPAVVHQLVSYAGDAGGSLSAPPTKQALAALMDTSGSAQQRGERLLALLFPAAYRSAHPGYAAAFPIPTETMAPAAIVRQNTAIGEWRGVSGQLKTIACPALFVTGTDDVISPPQNAAMMAARVPGSWLQRFAGAGHGLMYQDPQGLAQSVLTFLDVTAPTATGG